jgi:ribosomal protein L3
MNVVKIVAGLSEENVKTGLYVSKGRGVEGIAKKLGIKVGKMESNDLQRVREILSKGEPLSKIVREYREA